MESSKSKTDLGSGFGLSFLDILCCGLGAVVLLLLVVRHGQQPVQVEVPTVTQIQELQAIRKAITEAKIVAEQAQEEQDKLELTVKEQRDNARSIADAGAPTSPTLNAILEVIKEISTEDAELQRLQQEFAALDTENAKVIPTPVPTPRKVSGAVEGIKLVDIDRVAVLFDISASMLHRSLVEIVKLKASEEIIQVRARKWRQALNAAAWAYDSISLQSRYKVLMFSENVYDTSGNKVNAHYDISGNKVNAENLAWDMKNKEDLPGFREMLRNLIPKAGTDLELALRSLDTLVPRPQKLLIITDGLPNQAQMLSMAQRVAMPGCSSNSISPNSTTNSECRLSIALASIAQHAARLSGIPIDVILLPLDGDSMAIRFYSLVTSAAGGRVLTPSQDWLLN